MATGSHISNVTFMLSSALTSCGLSQTGWYASFCSLKVIICTRLVLASIFPILSFELYVLRLPARISSGTPLSLRSVLTVEAKRIRSEP